MDGLRRPRGAGFFLHIFDGFCDLLSDIDFQRFLCRLGRQHGFQMVTFSHPKTVSESHRKSMLFSMPSLGCSDTDFSGFWDVKSMISGSIFVLLLGLTSKNVKTAKLLFLYYQKAC